MMSLSSSMALLNLVLATCATITIDPELAQVNVDPARIFGKEPPQSTGSMSRQAMHK